MNFQSLLIELAQKYQVETVLERILGSAPMACDALATRGKRVVLTHDDGPLETATFDMVVAHGEGPPPGPRGDDWRAWFTTMAKRASKLVVVETANPVARGLLARLMPGRASAEWGATQVMAPVLWDLGRVRDHVFLDVRDGVPRRVAARLAHRHVFVVDVAPRTPQARRKVVKLATV